jgi:DNA-binding response OmpR family regulator
VEDNPQVQLFNKPLLEGKGFIVRQAETLAGAREIIGRELPALIILDVHLPDGNGLDFLRELRSGRADWSVKAANNSPPSTLNSQLSTIHSQFSTLNSQLKNIPVVALTNNRAEQDLVDGFAGGCDDYITKPYTFPVLYARIEAVLRRAAIVPDTLTKGSLTVDVTSRRAFISGRDLLLKPKEFDVLLYFVRNEGLRIVAETLYAKVWGQDIAGDDNAVRFQVSSLRKKLAGSGYTITNERGEGYCFEQE